MNRTVKILTAGLAVAALSVGGAAIATADAGTLESEESTSLTFSREEEKLARDLYTAFGEKYDSVVWDRIAASEQRHFDAVGRLLEQYELSDPTEGKDAGEFADATIQGLYADWLKDGSTEDAAFQAAIELETRDIADLKAQLDAVDDEAIEQVYQSLLRGSERHLAAFTAAANGETLEGQPPAWAGQRRGGDGTGPAGAMCDGTGQNAPDGAPMNGTGGPGQRLRDGSGNEDAPRRGMNR
ncbi:DUF2202 domain-containing protein [Tessaracoccus lapidicaptus]|uniref:DUF2202 domain-containing protein n=1 Tax=Tessaracoccus lapidicaptus TaxID=1427523 RepID=UPI00333F1CE1